MTDTPLRSGEAPGDQPLRWADLLIIEAIALAVILGIVLLLQYSEEGKLRRDGIRVTATVTELPLGEDSCGRCPVEFMIEEERYHVEETLTVGRDRRWYYGEAVDLYVDPNDMTHVVKVDTVDENVALGLTGIVGAAVVAVAMPVYVLVTRLKHRSLMRTTSR